MRSALTAIVFAAWAALPTTANAQGCSYAVTPLTLTVPGAGGSGQIQVTTGAACSWTASGTSWVSVMPANGVGSGTVTYVATANPLRTQRFASLMIAGRAVFIGQSQPTTTGTAPGAPRQLAASTSGSSVTLTWSPPDSGGAPSSYAISAGSASGLSNLANVVTGSTQTMFAAAGLPNGTYFVRVSAQNAAGTSAPSNEVSFTVGQHGCAVAPPSGLQSAVSGSLVTLTWLAPAQGVVATSYVLDVGTSPTLSDVGSFNTGSSATAFAGHAPPGRYHVRVRAATTCGLSTASAEVTVVVQP